MSEGRKKRKARQRKRERYQILREELQLSGDIPTVPEGAIRPEQVDPAKQTEDPQVGLVGEAIRKGWAVPEERKPEIVDQLLKIVDDQDMPAKVKVAAFNALRMADQQQYERDYPERAAKSRGGTTINNTVTTAVQVSENQLTASEIREMVLSGDLGCLEEMPTPDLAGPPGALGHEREMEGTSPPESDQQCAGQGMDGAEQ